MNFLQRFTANVKTPQRIGAGLLADLTEKTQNISRWCNDNSVFTSLCKKLGVGRGPKNWDQVKVIQEITQE